MKQRGIAHLLIIAAVPLVLIALLFFYLFQISRLKSISNIRQTAAINDKQLTVDDTYKYNEGIELQKDNVNTSKLDDNDDDIKYIGNFNQFCIKDNAVYFSHGNEQLKNSDPHTFFLLSASFAKDKNQAYHYRIGGGPEGIYVIIMDNVDPDSFDAINSNNAKDKNHVYYASWRGYEIIEGADPHSIEIIDGPQGYYLKDKNHIYYKDSLINDADPDTFTPIYYTKQGDTSYGVGYSVDKYKVFYCDSSDEPRCSTVIDADPNTVQLVYNKAPYSVFNLAKDNRFLFSSGVKVTNSDSATFEFLDSTPMERARARDKNNLYTLECHMAGCSLLIVDEF